MHPSYEDRPGAPDPRLRRGRRRRLRGARRRLVPRPRGGRTPPGADVLHLHHLTPLHEAAARVAPDVPVRRPPARHRAAHARGDRRRRAAGLGPRRRVGAADAPLGGRAASACCVLSPDQVGRAADLLGLDPERCVVAPNGFDPERFAPHRRRPRRALAPPPRRRAARLAAGRRGGLGRLHRRGRVAPLAQGPVLLAVGRFTAVKRIGAARPRVRARPASGLAEPASLVLLGGHPGEWEGEHPFDVDRRRRRAPTSSSPAGTTTTRCRRSSPRPTRVVLASVREQFGSVLVEGMACGLPADRRRPLRARRDRRRRARPAGWSSPTTRRALAAALRRGRRPTRPSARAAAPPRARARARALLVAGAGRPPRRRAATRSARAAHGGRRRPRIVEDLNHRAILLRGDGGRATRRSSAPSCGASPACSARTAAGSAPCSRSSPSRPAWAWSRRSCCARSSTSRSRRRDTALLTWLVLGDDRDRDRHRARSASGRRGCPTSSASASCTTCAPRSTATCSGCRWPSSRARAPARCSRASPTTSAACRTSSRRTATSIVSNVDDGARHRRRRWSLLDWRLAAFSLALLPLFVWITRRVGRERKKHHRRAPGPPGRHVVARRGVAVA